MFQYVFLKIERGSFDPSFRCGFFIEERLLRGCDGLARWFGLRNSVRFGFRRRFRDFRRSFRLRRIGLFFPDGYPQRIERTLPESAVHSGRSGAFHREHFFLEQPNVVGFRVSDENLRCLIFLSGRQFRYQPVDFPSVFLDEFPVFLPFGVQGFNDRLSVARLVVSCGSRSGVFRQGPFPRVFDEIPKRNFFWRHRRLGAHRRARFDLGGPRGPSYVRF